MAPNDPLQIYPSFSLCKTVRSVIKANELLSTFMLNHCLAGTQVDTWNYGCSQLFKWPNVMSFSTWNGLQNLSQICVVTCLTQRASTAHAPFGNFRKQDRPLFTPANGRALAWWQHVEEVLSVFKMLVSRTNSFKPPGTSSTCYVTFK